MDIEKFPETSAIFNQLTLLVLIMIVMAKTVPETSVVLAG
jgi:hypothetical protein